MLCTNNRVLLISVEEWWQDLTKTPSGCSFTAQLWPVMTHLTVFLGSLSLAWLCLESTLYLTFTLPSFTAARNKQKIVIFQVNRHKIMELVVNKAPVAVKLLFDISFWLSWVDFSSKPFSSYIHSAATSFSSFTQWIFYVISDASFILANVWWM